MRRGAADGPGAVRHLQPYGTYRGSRWRTDNCLSRPVTCVECRGRAAVCRRGSQRPPPPAPPAPGSRTQNETGYGRPIRPGANRLLRTEASTKNRSGWPGDEETPERTDDQAPHEHADQKADHGDPPVESRGWTEPATTRSVRLRRGPLGPRAAPGVPGSGDAMYVMATIVGLEIARLYKGRP